MSKGSKQTTTQSIDPLQRQLLSQNYATSMQVADRPFQAYTGERVAGFTPTQTQAQGLSRNIASDTSGQAAYGSAINTARGMLDYQPGTVSAPTVSAGMLRDTDLTPYLNPYTQNVIDASLGDLSLARDQQRVADNQSATAAKAWGGSRQGVADSLTNDAYYRNVASTTAGLRSAAYDKAVEAATGDINRRYSADTFNAGNLYDASKFNIGNDLTAQNLRLNAANSLTGFTDAQLTDALKRAGVISAIGDQEQQLNQARNDAAYQEFLRELNYPIEQQNIRNAALGLFPSAMNSTTTTSGGGILGGLGSALSGGAALYTAFSDARLKTDIQTTRLDEKGRRWVSWRWLWDAATAPRRYGVIAQEVQKTDPDAVSRDPVSGYFKVNYAMLGA